MKKKSNKKGFTIMEMLIVVAIIAVLAAIAIPTFNGALTKSKEAADVANIRAAYAEIQVGILTGDDTITFPANEGAAKGLITDKTGAFKGKGTFTATLATKSVTYTYKSTKLTGGNDTTDASGKTFKWVLNNPTIE